MPELQPHVLIPEDEVPVEVKYLGFDIPDRWVVGYGLDLGEQGRTLPYIGWLEAERPPR